VVPDIGDFKDVAVIELLVKPGDTVKVEQSLITVERQGLDGDPLSHAGVVKELKVKLGDKVNQGSLVLTLEARGGRGGPHRQRPHPHPRLRRCAPATAPPWRPAAPATPAVPTSNATCWCWAPARAAIRPPSAPPTWA
jgi:pyruvate/2-oxoglutarate dehydrogenase complex dihydrolipoamide acyltransferase (E2) component